MAPSDTRTTSRFPVTFGLSGSLTFHASVGVLLRRYATAVVEQVVAGVVVGWLPAAGGAEYSTERRASER